MAADMIAHGDMLFGWARGDEFPVAVLQIGWFTIPFLLLLATRTRRYWIAASLLTASFWAFFVYSIWRASLNDFAGGADIGLGIIMLFAPVLIMIVLAAMAGARRLATK